jgi:hypothetical protein
LAAAAGFDTFPMWDGKKGKVLRVDLRDVYVRVDEKVYGIHIGQNLAEALKRPLSAKELKGLGLSP